MWKVVALVLVIGVLGHFAVRYLRPNPLGPVVEGNQVVVTSQNYEVHFDRSGPVAGTYFVSVAESRDLTDRPVNAVLWVIEAGPARDFMRGYADFHLYGSESSERLRNVGTQLALVAANAATYTDLLALVAQHERRADDRGERLCVTLAGTALNPASCVSLETGGDASEAAKRLVGDTPVVFAESLDVDDCTKVLGVAAR
jgi:hypothetical protein